VVRTVVVPLAAGVWRVPTAPADLVNSFVLRAQDGSVTLVDAGLRRASGRILAALAEIGVRAAEVRRVVLTHAHADHAGGLPKIIEMTGAEVHSHERESVYLRDGRGPQYDRSSRQARLIGRLGRRKLPTVAVTQEFRDGLLIPGDLRVVHTPGHTPGHVSLLHEPSGVLITGDAVFNVRRLSWPPPWLCTDPTVNRRSADALGDLDYEIAAFTHGPEIRQAARAAVRAFLRGRAR
jgi:glyoxylase-like metal-dependent hydrolase (beta-lactamase superfamily II)